MPAPLSLTDPEMDAVMQAAAPLDPAHRDAFLRDIAAELRRRSVRRSLVRARLPRDPRRAAPLYFTPLRTWDAIGKRL